MKRNKDLTGYRFGRLTVLGFAGYVRGGKEQMWTCRCDCGNLVQYEGVKLKHGRRVSCGCREKEIRQAVANNEWFNKLNTKQKHVRGMMGGKNVVLEKELTKVYPQDEEKNEYRYFDPHWLNEIAIGLTAGAVKHPGETWRSIPASEHVSRAVRHLIMWLGGDRSEPHLINASMRVMMAFATDKEEHKDDD